MAIAKLLGNRKYRNAFLQAAFVACIGSVIASAVLIVRRNLAVQGVTVGWDFLNYSTGWTISFSVIPYTISDTYTRALLVGFLNTLLLGVISIALSIALGTVIGAARLSQHKLVNLIASTYVQIFRNLPLILQAFFWYTLITHLPPPRTAIALPGDIYISNRGVFFPDLNVTWPFICLAGVVTLAGLSAGILCAKRRRRALGIMIFLASLAVSVGVLATGRIPDLPMLNAPAVQGLRFVGGAMIVPELTAAIVAISLFGAAYIAEIVRAGFKAIPNGMIEAGSALGLRKSQVFWRIRMPLMIRIVLPIMTNQTIWLMKATTVGIAIGFTDFFAAVATSINNAGQTLSLIFILVLGFWAINMTIAFVMNAINRAVALPGYKQ